MAAVARGLDEPGRGDEVTDQMAEVFGGQMSDETKSRAPYEAPAVTDFGSIEEITRGQLAVNLDDFPVGARLIAPSGAIPPPAPPPILPSL